MLLKWIRFFMVSLVLIGLNSKTFAGPEVKEYRFHGAYTGHGERISLDVTVESSKGNLRVSKLRLDFVPNSLQSEFGVDRRNISEELVSSVDFYRGGVVDTGVPYSPAGNSRAFLSIGLRDDVFKGFSIVFSDSGPVVNFVPIEILELPNPPRGNRDLSKVFTLSEGRTSHLLPVQAFKVEGPNSCRYSLME